MTTRKNGTVANINALTQEMYSDTKAVRAGKLSIEKAGALSALAGKIISATRAQIEYAHARKEKPEIPFLK